jgi:hypothetical protein
MQNKLFKDLLVLLMHVPVFMATEGEANPQGKPKLCRAIFQRKDSLSNCKALERSFVLCPADLSGLGCQSFNFSLRPQKYNPVMGTKCN